MKNIFTKTIITTVFIVAFCIVSFFVLTPWFTPPNHGQLGIAPGFYLPAAVIILLLPALFVIRIDNLKKRRKFTNEISYQASLLDTVADAIFSTDANLVIVSWNNYAAELYGIAATDAIGKHLNSLITLHLSDEQLNESLQDLLLTNNYKSEYLVTKKDGGQIYIMASISTILDGHQKVTGYVAVHRDISARKALEDELKKLNRQLAKQVVIKDSELSGIFERITDGFVAVDSNWNYTYVNSRVCKLFGLMPADFIGKNMWTDFPGWNNEPYFYDLYHTAMASQQYHFRELYYTPLEVWLECNVYPSQTGISVYFRDVTQKKKAEEQVKKASTLSNIIIDSLPGIFFMYDKETNAMLRWNKMVEHITGFTETEVAGKYFIEFIDPRDQAALAQKIEDSYKRGQGDIEAGIVTSKGNIIPFYFTAMLVEIDGKKFLIGNGIDISARRKAEAASKKNFDKIQLLAMLSEAVSRADNKEQICRLGLEAVLKNISTFKAAITLFTNTGELSFMADKDLSTDFKQGLKIFPAYNMVEKRSTWFLTSNFKEAGAADATIKLFEEEGIYSGYDIPITYQGKVIGKIVLYYNSIFKIPDEKKQLAETIAGGLGFAISEKNAEEALIASKQKYQLLFYKNPMPMWMISHPERNFVDVNEAAILHYGYSREEFLQMNVSDIRPGEEVENVAAEKQAINKDENYKGIWRHKKKNGEIIRVEIIAHDITYEEKNVRLILANNIDEKMKAEEKLQQSYAQIRQLANHLQKIREQERTHIAREIHDELGQQLTGLKMYVSWLSKKNVSEDVTIKAKFSSTMELIEDTIKSVRKISTELRPSMLDDLGLIAAMEWQSSEFGKRSGIEAVFINLTGKHQVPARFSTGLFRIFQESLTNVARHADAKKIISTLAVNNGELVLTIEDNGKGFIVKNIGSKKTLGLFGMKERTMEMGGNYEIKSEPGYGTTVSVKIRLHA